MLQLKKHQIDVFKGKALKKFEDEMLLHVQEYFPNHFEAIGEDNVRNSIKHAFRRGKTYGLISVRNVCLYLNTMILLGSHFDIDPQYVWAKDILINTKEKNINTKTDSLSDSTEKYLDAISGNNNADVYRTLLNITGNRHEILRKLLNGDLQNAAAQLHELFPKKAEVIGPQCLHELVKLGKRNAARYGIRDEGCLLVFVVLMYSLGAGFDTDPQFPWATEILSFRTADEMEKTMQLYDTYVARLAKVLSNFIP